MPFTFDTCSYEQHGAWLSVVGGHGRITDQGSQRPVQWFFDNLLPEEGARAMLARDAHIDAADAFGLLRQDLSDHIFDGPQECYRPDWGPRSYRDGMK